MATFTGGMQFTEGFSLIIAPVSTDLWIGTLGPSSIYDTSIYSMTSNSTDSVYVNTFTQSQVNARSIIKITSSGNISWQKSFTTTGMYRDQDLDPSGNLYITGQSSSDVYLTKAAPNGDAIWQRSIGTATVDDGFGVKSSLSGANVYVSGYYTTTKSIGFLSKFSSDGDIVFSKSYGTNTDSSYINRIVETSDAVYLLGQDTIAGESSITLTKLDLAGTRLWYKILGDPDLSGDLYGTSLFVEGTDIYIVGYLGSGGLTLVAKYDTSGNLQWKKLWELRDSSTSNSCFVYKSVLLNSTLYVGYTLTQLAVGNIPIGSKGGIAAFDLTGNVAWNRRITHTSGNLSVGPLSGISTSSVWFTGTISDPSKATVGRLDLSSPLAVGTYGDYTVSNFTPTEGNSLLVGTLVRSISTGTPTLTITNTTATNTAPSPLYTLTKTVL